MQTSQIQRYIVRLILLTGSVLLGSCINEKLDDITPSYPDSKVTISLSLPKGGAKSASTYADTTDGTVVGTVAENKVDEIDVLAFVPDNSNPSKWAYAYKAVGQGIKEIESENNSKKEFTVTLQKKTANQMLVILANAHKEIEALGYIALNSDKNALLERLISVADINNANKWDVSTAFPMWGEKEALIDDNVETIEEVPMLRATARVDIALSDALYASGKFILNEIYVYKSNNQGAIAPYSGNYPDDKKSVTKASIPTGTEAVRLLYELNKVTGVPVKQTFEQNIYIYEAIAAPSKLKATALVIGGKYNGVQGYYRVDFMNKDHTQYLAILRNHLYKFNINDVNGPGQDNPDDAYNVQTVNMQVNVTGWNGYDESVVFDDTYYISFKPGREYTFTASASSQTVEITTDYPDGFTFTQLTKIVNGVEVTVTDQTTNWFKISEGLNTPLGKDGNVKPVAISVDANPDSSPRVGYIYVKSGRIETKIKITQEKFAVPVIPYFKILKESLEIDNLLFAARSGTQPEAQTFILKWGLPSGSSSTKLVKIEQTGYTLFPNGAGTNVPASGITYYVSPTSTTITPPAMNTAELPVDNPLAPKESVLTFTMTPESGDPITKTLKLTQVIPAISIEGLAKTYVLDGSNYHFRVRCNVPWTISKISENIGLVPGQKKILVSGIAGNNLIENHPGGIHTEIGGGEEIRFTVEKNGTDASGTLQITFAPRSTDPNQQFDPVTKTLYFGYQYFPEPHQGWAGSNIYWDGKKLTFDDINNTTNAQAQGLFFKWGSLYGISPAGADRSSWSTSTKLYSVKGEVINSNNVYPTFLSIPLIGNDISVATTPLNGKYEADRDYPYEKNDVDKGVGDICAMITEQNGGSLYGKKWRMPTRNEFINKDGDNYTSSEGSSAALIGTADGKFKVNIWQRFNSVTPPVYFPISGYRDGRSNASVGLGKLFAAGTGSGYYWSSSPSGVDNTYYLSVGNGVNITSPFGDGKRQNAVAIRCVVQNPLDYE